MDIHFFDTKGILLSIFPVVAFVIFVRHLIVRPGCIDSLFEREKKCRDKDSYPACSEVDKYCGKGEKGKNRCNFYFDKAMEDTCSLSWVFWVALTITAIETVVIFFQSLERPS